MIVGENMVTKHKISPERIIESDHKNKPKVGILFETKPSAEKIVEWLWSQSGLDSEDESWHGLMFADAVNKIKSLTK